MIGPDIYRLTSGRDFATLLAALGLYWALKWPLVVTCDY